MKRLNKDELNKVPDIPLIDIRGKKTLGWQYQQRLAYKEGRLSDSDNFYTVKTMKQLNL